MHCCRFASAVRIGDDLWKLPLNWAVFRLLIGIFSPNLADQTELLFFVFLHNQISHVKPPHSYPEGVPVYSYRSSCTGQKQPV